MIATGPLLGVGLVVAIGGLLGRQARRQYSQYATLTELVGTTTDKLQPGRSATLRGEVSVSDPATPDRTHPEAEPDRSPALWAWRIRRKTKRGGTQGRLRWRTIEGGLGVGTFALDHGWEEIPVEIPSETTTALQDGEDPFDSTRLYLDTPDVDIPLGEEGILNRWLQKAGVAGDGGALSNVEITVALSLPGMDSITNRPDRYQATVIEEGEELVVKGHVIQRGDDVVLTDTDDTPLVIAESSLENKAERTRRNALIIGALALSITLIGGGAFGAATLGVL